jgi:hypothetical protein
MSSIEAALNDSHARRALAAFQAIVVGDDSHASFVRQALDQLSQLIGSDLTTLGLCDLERGTRSVTGRQGEAISEQDVATFNHYFREHPLVRYHGTHRGGPTQRITDCVSQQTFQRSAVFSDYYRRIGINYVMALPLWIDDANVISIVFNRSSSNFSDADRAALDTLRQPLGALYRNIVARERASVCQRSLQGIVASSGWHLVAVAGDGRLVEMSDAAARVLRNFFVDAPRGAHGNVPAPLATWLRRRSRNWGLDRLQTAPFSLVREGAKLTVHFVADPSARIRPLADAARAIRAGGPGTRRAAAYRTRARGSSSGSFGKDQQRDCNGARYKRAHRPKTSRACVREAWERSLVPLRTPHALSDEPASWSLPPCQAAAAVGWSPPARTRRDRR